MTNEVSEVYNYATDADLIFICDYDEQRNYFYGENAVFSLQKLKSINSVIGIVHLYGHVQYETLCEDGMFVFPKRSGKPFFMSETLSYIGLNPVIKLQVAGLKVGQELLEKKLTSLSQLISGKI